VADIGHKLTDVTDVHAVARGAARGTPSSILNTLKLFSL